MGLRRIFHQDRLEWHDSIHPSYNGHALRPYSIDSASKSHPPFYCNFAHKIGGLLHDHIELSTGRLRIAYIRSSPYMIVSRTINHIASAPIDHGQGSSHSKPSRRRLNDGSLITRRIQVRKIIIQLIHTRHIRLLGPERIRQRPIIILPHQVRAIKDEIGGNSIGRCRHTVPSEAHRENFVGGGTNVEQGVGVEDQTGSSSRGD